MKKNDVSSEYHKLLDKRPIGIICGVSFPQKFQDMAKDGGLIIVYPGGGRYKVKIPEDVIQKISPNIIIIIKHYFK